MMPQRTTRLAWAFLGMVMSLWVVSAAVLLWPQAPIFHSTGVDTLTPTGVRENAAFIVTRHFSVARDVSVYASRSIVRGDCRPSCTVIDLPSEYSTLEQGDHVRARVHILPQYVEAGEWRFRVTLHWSDIFGRPRRFDFQELTFRVEK